MFEEHALSTLAVIASGISACRGAAGVATEPPQSEPSRGTPIAAPSARAVGAGDETPEHTQRGCEPAPAVTNEESVVLEWQKTLFADKASGTVHVVDADDSGVWAAGKAFTQHPKPFVARYTRDGREVWRVGVDYPRGVPIANGAVLAIAGAPSKSAFVLAASWSRADADVVLAKLDEHGAPTWSARTDFAAQPPPVLVADAEGGALVATTVNPKSGARSISIAK